MSESQACEVYALDANGKRINLGDLVYAIDSHAISKGKPYRVEEITFVLQRDGKNPKTMLKARGQKQRFDSARVEVVDSDTDFGRVADLIQRLGGVIDADAINAYLEQEQTVASGRVTAFLDGLAGARETIGGDAS